MEAHLAGEGTYEELAVRFSIGEASISRLLRRFRESGGIEPREYGGGFPARIADDQLDALRKLVAERPDRTKEELRAAWVERFGGTASTSSIGRALKRAGITREKKSFTPTEQLREAVQERRFAFAEIVAEYPTERLVFIDESGCNVAMTPMYARAPRGQRAYDDKPASWGQNVSVIGAIRDDRVLCHRSFFGAVNTERFLDFSAKTLAPRLQTDDVVILDNLQPHKHPEVRAIVEAQGASLLLLPPYSPDLNPIELLWPAHSRK